MIPRSGLENTRHVALSQVCRTGWRKEIQTPGRLPASASCPATERKAKVDSEVEKKNQKSGVMMQILFFVEPGRTKCGCTRLNPSPAEEDGQNSRTDGRTDGRRWSAPPASWVLSSDVPLQLTTLPRFRLCLSSSRFLACVGPAKKRLCKHKREDEERRSSRESKPGRGSSQKAPEQKQV